MNDMIKIGKQLTMSSLDIAELTGKRHADVMRDTRTMLDGLGIGLSIFASSYVNAQNKDQPCYNLPKRETLILVSGYSVELRARIIDRWQELEEAAVAPVPAVDPMQVLNDPAAMRGLLLNYSEKVIALEAKVEEQKTDVDALERIAKSDGSMCVTDAAKTLQVRPTDLFKFLRSNGWIYRRAGGTGDIAYQAKLMTGLLEHKTTTVERSDGSEKTVTQVRVTPKGIARLAREFPPALRLVG